MAVPFFVILLLMYYMMPASSFKKFHFKHFNWKDMHFLSTYFTGGKRKLLNFFKYF